MAKVTITYRGGIADAIGIREEQAEQADISGVLAHIKKTHGTKIYKTAKTMIVAVNGQNILLSKRYKTALKDGDKVMFLPISGGG